MPERPVPKVALSRIHEIRPEDAMNEFTITTHIGRPAGDVFAAITDVARTPAWTPGLSGAR